MPNLPIARRALAGLLLAVGAPRPAGATLEALFAPGKALWPRWTAHDPASAERVDHGAFATLLGRHVAIDASGIARFSYRRVGAAERAALQVYLAGLGATPVSRLARPEQFAFWVNLYNALTIEVVLAHYPVKSILDIDISPGWFARGPWGRPLIAVDGQALTLNDIEHRILRPIWDDPRIHYAVNCAALGCPNLAAEPFTAAADAMLTAAAGTYVNHPRGARIEGGGLVTSKIYDWYQEDFGGSERAVVAHLRRHAAPPLAQALAGITDIAGYDYDWRLNDAQ
jgi:Protein of unknown function, DUF547